MVDELYRCSIVAFIDILEKIFDRSDRGSDLDVDVTVVFCGQVWIIRYDMCIGEYMAMFMNPDAIIPSSVDRISIYFWQCFIAEIFGILFAAFAVLHARCIWPHRATGSMEHGTYDGIV